MRIISKLEDLFKNIKEKNANDLCFEVRHKVLEIPRDLYFQTIPKYDNPLSEEAVQYIVEEYLDWKDDHGLVGMIRVNDNKERGLVELDAAVRYVVNCEDSVCKDCQ
ncbi:hypothetical protein U472_02600 [Orenia metallireducens]|uniref:Uncharacterized protein n=1 Tax=Orenia metallireducens TaxID=1413210 RepID=A0A1C0ACK2_9FIRM|nr:hypothetical protein [Orenia metallireducens]OCL28101.1 hypothetical protein U472_02600 [Orenia metallireducens]